MMTELMFCFVFSRRRRPQKHKTNFFSPNIFLFFLSFVLKNK
jgi:hypothetical protein